MGPPPSEKPQENGATFGWGDKKAVISGQNGLIIFLIAALLGVVFYTLEIQGDKLDKAVAEHHKIYIEDTSRQLARHSILMEESAKRSVETSKLLELTLRQVAAIEIIAARVGSYIRPYEEQRYNGPQWTP